MGKTIQKTEEIMFIAAIFGAAIGLKIHFKNQHNYQEIIDQIEDFKIGRAHV